MYNGYNVIKMWGLAYVVIVADIRLYSVHYYYYY